MEYWFDYDDDVMDIQFEYKPEERERRKCAKQWYKTDEGKEALVYMQQHGYDINDEDERYDFAIGDDDYAEYEIEYFRKDALDAFYQDPDVLETVAETREYRKDPYAYYGVSRSDFF